MAANEIIRGYEIYSIGPRNSIGDAVGGEKQLVINAEYIWAVGGPVYLILFHDRGNAWSQDQKFSLTDVYTLDRNRGPDLHPGPDGFLSA